MTRLSALALACLLGAFALGSTQAALAQEVSARDRQSASEAYDRGTAAYLARNYEEAARWFETAHRLAPAPAALVQALRASQRGGADVRAANLALRLQALYPDDRAAQRAASDALRNARRFVRVDVECEGCAVAVGGAVVEHRSFFVEPDAEHTIEAAFETGSRSETVRGAAGEQRTLRFEAPPPPVARVEPEPESVSASPLPTVSNTPPSDGLAVIPLPATLVSVGVTAALGGVLIWSGVDTLDGVPAYTTNPTAAGLADGQSRETRTNWLVGATALAATVTAVLAVFTRWSERAPAGAAARRGVGLGLDLALDGGVQPDGAFLSLRGRL
jgi:hypothetical protein